MFIGNFFQVRIKYIMLAKFGKAVQGPITRLEGSSVPSVRQKLSASLSRVRMKHNWSCQRQAFEKKKSNDFGHGECVCCPSLSKKSSYFGTGTFELRRVCQQASDFCLFASVIFVLYDIINIPALPLLIVPLLYFGDRTSVILAFSIEKIVLVVPDTQLFKYFLLSIIFCLWIYTRIQWAFRFSVPLRRSNN